MKIALIGYGRMGKTIEPIVLQRGHEILCRVDVDNRADWLKPEKLSAADVAIEFTTPESAVDNILACFEAGVPVVCGTTGWLHRWPEVAQRCREQNQTLVYASNFSLGVNLFFALNKYLAQLMAAYPQYEVDIREIHHTGKKDAPSGTAITLAEQILQRISRKKQWVNRPAERPDELSVISERVDPVPGIHVVKYSSAVDEIEIRHTAHSREGFALGAVLAAEWVKGKKGIFSMEDVLGLK
ncbi:dihydrodipicolinate reductase [Thermoflavifilum aggregans]|uniref:4-hydroxy-tetrahydrodipicolinate reductase n=1 Tax=Thermoflavifilum aggregans TaxID=454188 RepID=A0A2M9CWQ3_9BACT|nr:4-hydroxy-tetrahydrodipicolinate reductase [Thermoflavifilum aggregans]PJJ76344.1 dihydrodipicolinate reductase [Thermoflavifilum aggregans]